ncbi:hypothetical protein JCM14124_19100 [Humidesulfovibrio idahonensis]
MRNAKAYRRVIGRMADGGAFKRVSRRKKNRLHALRSDGSDEEEQQAEQREQKKNGGRLHHLRPGGYGWG